jgi:glycosyltransferase involved in cell wall biosynthesis
MLVSTGIYQTTGYSKVSYNILKQLDRQTDHSKIKIVHYAIQSQNHLSSERKYPENITVYDALSLENPKNAGFGFAELPQVIEKENPTVVMIYNDLAVVSTYVNAIKAKIKERNFKLWVYVDQVYECQQPHYINMLNAETDRLFCFTNKWRDILKKQGINRPIDVLPHGFDPSVFPSQVSRRKELREKIGIPDNIFLFMSINRNQPRKRQDILIMAFVELITKHPHLPLFLMCICDKGDKGGYQLFDIFKRELELKNAQIDHYANRLLISQNDLCYTDEQINLFYNIANAGVSCVDGEGFGLCTFEQMGVGVPQVVSDVVGHQEYCNNDNSVIISDYVRCYIPMSHSGIGGELKIMNHMAVAQGMEKYVLDPELLQRHGKNAMDTIAKYSWERCVHPLAQRLALVSLSAE